MKKVLLIDDDPDILSLISYILTEEGYTVKASPVGEIVSKISSVKPDVILIDCWLPGCFGDDLCRDIKSNPLHKHIPVILISAINNLPFIAKECKADAFVEKPFDVEHLVSVVNRYFEGSVK